MSAINYLISRRRDISTQFQGMSVIKKVSERVIDFLSEECIRGRHPGVSCRCSGCLQPGNRIKIGQPSGPAHIAQYGSGYQTHDFANQRLRKNSQMG